MKNARIFLIALAFTLLCINVFGRADNYPFQVKISGKGKQSIIFIPGFASSAEVWKETVANYESKFTCYTLTMAGFAGVPAQASPTFNVWKNAIVAYIKANHLSRPVIVGHSMGGGLALAIAADYPELPGRIVIVDALPCLAAMGNPSFKSKQNNDCSAIVSRFIAMPDDRFKMMQQMGMSQLLADTSRIKMVVNWSVTSDRATFATMYCDFLNTDLREKISGITCPALILLEFNFNNYKPAITDQYKNLKNAQLVYATKGLHFIMYDDTLWYNRQLSAFIK